MAQKRIYVNGDELSCGLVSKNSETKDIFCARIHQGNLQEKDVQTGMLFGFVGTTIIISLVA